MCKLPYGLELKPGATAALKPGELSKVPMLKTSGAVPDFEVEHIKGLERGLSNLEDLTAVVAHRGGVGLPRCALRELRRLQGSSVLVGRVGT